MNDNTDREVEYIKPCECSTYRADNPKHGTAASIDALRPKRPAFFFFGQEKKKRKLKTRDKVSRGKKRLKNNTTVVGVAYLLPKNESFANEIFHQVVTPNIPIECMARKLGVSLYTSAANEGIEKMKIKRSLFKTHQFEF